MLSSYQPILGLVLAVGAISWFVGRVLALVRAYRLENERTRLEMLRRTVAADYAQRRKSA